MRVAILANGAPPSRTAPPAFFAAFVGADLLVACDGALATARSIGRDPDYVVGDGDSISPDDRDALGASFILDAEQDTNDLCKAFRFVQTLPHDGTLSVTILCATGLREDHSLANIFHLLDFAEDIPDTTILTDTGTFVAIRDKQTFPCHPGDSVSVFAPFPGTHVTSCGLVWPLDGVDLAPLWRGTLNRTTGIAFTLHTNHPILLYRPHG